MSSKPKKSDQLRKEDKQQILKDFKATGLPVRELKSYVRGVMQVKNRRKK